jgi:hypothetical protein
MAISTELLNGILEMVYIASLEGNTIVVPDAKDGTESISGNGGCIINANKERCDTNSIHHASAYSPFVALLVKKRK